MTLAILTVDLFKDHLMTEFAIHVMTLKTTSFFFFPGNPNLQ